MSDFRFKEGTCRVPMWCDGLPSGFCGERAFGEQLQREVLAQRDPRYLIDHPVYCSGLCCPNHGGPEEGEPIIFQDGWTKSGRPMWCAVMPDFTNLHESPAGFSGDGRIAIEKLKEVLAKARGESND